MIHIRRLRRADVDMLDFSGNQTRVSHHFVAVGVNPLQWVTPSALSVVAPGWWRRELGASGAPDAG
jgi:hypothetical protein